MKHSNTQTDLSYDPHHDPLPPAVVHLWSHMVMFEKAWHLVQAIRDWPGVAIAPNRCGLCIALDGVTIGQLRWSGRIDLPFGPALGDLLVAKGMASHDPDHPGTDRVVFDVRTVADVDRAVWLLRLAFLSADSKGHVILAWRNRTPLAKDNCSEAPQEAPRV